MPHIPNEPFFRLAPDWIAEVLSPTTAKYDRSEKLRIYRREQVGWAWLVDPLLRTLEVLRLGPDGWILIGTWRDDTKVRAEPFEVFELELSVLWADVVLTPQK